MRHLIPSLFVFLYFVIISSSFSSSRSSSSSLLFIYSIPKPSSSSFSLSTSFPFFFFSLSSSLLFLLSHNWIPIATWDWTPTCQWTSAPYRRQKAHSRTTITPTHSPTHCHRRSPAAPPPSTNTLQPTHKLRRTELMCGVVHCINVSNAFRRCLLAIDQENDWSIE